MKENKWIKVLDYFFVTRPMLFFPGWNTLIAGYLVASNKNNLFQSLYSEFSFWVPEVVLAMVIFMTAMGSCFIFNQLADIESDVKNKKLFLIGEKYVNRRIALIESIILSLISLFMSLFFDLTYMLTVLLFLVITGYFYNFHPLQLKNRPYWGIILNSLMGWLAFTLGWLIIDGVSISFIIKSMPYIFHNAALCLLTTIPDECGDKSTGKLTFCVRFGRKKTILISGLLYSISLILSFVIMDQFIVTLNLVLLYWVVYMVLSRTTSSAVKTIKMAIFFFSILICLKFPSYLLLMVTIFYLSKYYYKIRFDFNYPSFRGE